jgi:hypothetical protein
MLTVKFCKVSNSEVSLIKDKDYMCLEISDISPRVANSHKYNQEFYFWFICELLGLFFNSICDNPHPLISKSKVLSAMHLVP